MKTCFLWPLAFGAALAGTELIELSTARGHSVWEVPAGKLVRVESVTWSYQATSAPGPRAGVWWWDGVLTWAPWEVTQGNALLGPGQIQLVRGDLPRRDVLVLLRIESVDPVRTNSLTLRVQASEDLVGWWDTGQVVVEAPAAGQARFWRLVGEVPDARWGGGR